MTCLLEFKKFIIESEDKLNKIRNIIDNQNLILFFKKDGKIYGAPEESRVVFAKMKNPDEDATKSWIKEANFSAFDLEKALQGKAVEAIFSIKDFNKIKIIDKEVAETALSKEPSNDIPVDLKGPEDTGIVLKDKK
jgi:hypothetical protein